MKSAISVLRRWIELDRRLVCGGFHLYDFAKERGVSPSTLQRDLVAFRELGQVVWKRDGHRRGFGYYGESAPLFCCNVPPVEGTKTPPA